MTACDEGGRVQAERAASGALCHLPTRPGRYLMDAEGLKWELGLQGFLLLLRSEAAMRRWQFVRGL